MCASYILPDILPDILPADMSTEPMPTPLAGKYLKHELFEGTNCMRCYVHGDGNCLFHSLCVVLNWKGYRTGSNAEKIRLAVEFREHIIEKHAWDAFLEERGFPADLAPSFSVARNTRSDADDFVIRFVSDRLDINIFVLKSTNAVFPCSEKTDNAVCLLAWLNESHFEPIVRVFGEGEFFRCGVDDLPLGKTVLGEMTVPNDSAYQGLFSPRDSIIAKLRNLLPSPET
jgi:hypothetical protein